MESKNFPQLVFSVDFDERTAEEVLQKGWFRAAFALMPNGARVPLAFFDPVRLRQEIDAALHSGSSCFAEVCLIVVPEITKECMEAALRELYGSRFFEQETVIHAFKER